MQNKFTLAIHGGAGDILSTNHSEEALSAHLQVLTTILKQGHADLTAGMSAVDVVKQAVMALEDCEYFNAGRGSVLTANGDVEMDASIMSGENRLAGAVAAVRHLKNPICGAYAVMKYSCHTLLVDTGAEDFCQQHNVEIISPDYFITSARREQLLRVQAQQQKKADFGTVGAVALDRSGHLAAATSTGGIVNKLPGRVGDSPLIGAGTWADDETCAVSATGSGDIMIRCAFAHEIDALIRYKKLSLLEASQQVLQQLKHLGGEGGCIVVNRQGEIAMPFNANSMYRGCINETGKIFSAVLHN